MLKVSPSAIGLLLECPRCLWLFANEKIARPRGIFPSLPGGMDEHFKKYFDTFRLKGELPPEIKGKVNGKLFQDLTKLRTWREINFGRGGLVANFLDIDITLRGAIDELLINKKEELVPFDFKTRGYPTKEDTHKHYQHQLDLYALLFKENNLKVAEYGYLLFFWPKEYREGEAMFDTKLIKMSVSPKRGFEILKEVQGIVEGPKPKAHKDCEYCLYRGVGEGFEE